MSSSAGVRPRSTVAARVSDQSLARPGPAARVSMYMEPQCHPLVARARLLRHVLWLLRQRVVLLRWPGMPSAGGADGLEAALIRAGVQYGQAVVRPWTAGQFAMALFWVFVVAVILGAAGHLSRLSSSLALAALVLLAAACAPTVRLQAEGLEVGSVLEGTYVVRWAEIPRWRVQRFTDGLARFEIDLGVRSPLASLRISRRSLADRSVVPGAASSRRVSSAADWAVRTPVARSPELAHATVETLRVP